jgi:hypothetical protein
MCCVSHSDGSFYLFCCVCFHGCIRFLCRMPPQQYPFVYYRIVVLTVTLMILMQDNQQEAHNRRT